MVEVPQYVSQLIAPSYSPVQVSDAGVQNTRRASKELSEAAYTMEEEATASETLQVSTMLKSNISRIADSTQGDPAALSESLNEFKKGVGKNIESPQLSDELDYRFETEAQPYIDKAFNVQRENVNSDAQLSAQQNISQAGISARMVLPGLLSDIPEQRLAAGEALQLQFHDIEAAANAKGTNGKYLLTAEQRDKAIGGAKDDVMKQAASLWLAAQPDPIVALKEFNEKGFELELPDGEGGTVPFNVRDSLSNEAMVAFNKDAGKTIRTYSAAAKTEVGAGIDLMKQQNDLGLPVDTTTANQLLNKATSIGDAQQVAAIKAVTETNVAVQEFVPLGVADMQAGLVEAQKTALSNADQTSVTRYAALKGAYDKRIQAINSDDALNYYSDTGITEPLEPIDFNNAETLGAQIADRKSRQVLVQELDNVRVPIMNSADMDKLRQLYNDAPVGDRMAILSSVASKMDAEDAQDIASRIAPKDASMAATMSLIKDDPELAEITMLGSQREKFTSAQAINADLQTRFEGAIKDPRALSSVTTAVHNAYTELAARDNNTDKDINDDLMQKVVDRMVGPVVTINGKKVLPFKRPDGNWSDDTDFQRVLEHANIEAFSASSQGVPRYNGMKEITADQWHDVATDYNFQAVGDGAYNAISRSGATLTNKQGQPYVFDMNELSKGVQFNESWLGNLYKPVPTALDYAAKVREGKMTAEEAKKAYDHDEEVRGMMMKGI